MPRKSYKYIKLRAKEIIPLAKELINNKDYANLVILEDEIGYRKKAGLETLRFHDLRHIAISRMWSSGMNALEISACSGHRDIKMLMRYSHYQLTF